jgi:hypothetical protein
MTPSEAYETAWQRDTSHDEMTVACRDLIEKQWNIMPWHVKPDRKEPHNLVATWCEYFFVCDKGPRFFADILAKWECEYEETWGKPPNQRTDKRNHTTYVVFEIKPKIHSPGALLRQIRVQRERLAAWNSKSEVDIRVYPLVRTSDPFAGCFIDLSRMSLIEWDGADKLSFRNPPPTLG